MSTRYLLLPYPQHGHVGPMAALAAELRARGAEVLVATTPEFVTAFTEIGCTVTEFETGVSNAAVTARSGGRVRAAVRAAHAARERRRWLLGRLAREWPRWSPDLVVVDYVLGVGVRAARLARCPYAVLSVSYALNDEVVAADTARRFGPRVARAVRAAGLLRAHPALRMPASETELTLVNVLPELQPQRSSFDERFRFVGPLRRPGQESVFRDVDLPWERIAAGPTVYVSAGTVFTRGAEFFRKVAWAFAGSSWCVVLATAHTDPESLGVLPENVVARRYVPQSEVLAHCSAFVTHAGMNSALEGLALRLPMVLVPTAGDQVTTARQLERLGVGTVVDATASSVALFEAVSGVVGDPSVHAALDRLSRRVCAVDGPASAADALAEMAWRGVAATGRRP